MIKLRVTTIIVSLEKIAKCYSTRMRTNFRVRVKWTGIGQ